MRQVIKEPLKDVKPGDYLIRGTSEIVQVTTRSNQRVHIGEQKYLLDGSPYGHTSEHVRIPKRGEISHLKEQGELRKADEWQVSWNEAVQLVNLGRLHPQELIDKYGAQRIIAAWKALNAGPEIL